MKKIQICLPCACLTLFLLLAATHNLYAGEKLKPVATASWTGAVSSTWNEPGNWNPGIPDITTDVIIPASAVRMPVIALEFGTGRNVTVETGATLTVAQFGILQLYGNLVVNGTLDAVNGHLTFRGSSLQNASPFEARFLTMNGAGLKLGGDSKVSGGIIFDNGNIYLGDFDFTLSSGANGFAVSHIVTDGSGNVIVDLLAPGNSRIVPVGPDAASYNPVVIAANPNHIHDDFFVNVKAGARANGNSGAAFTQFAVDRTWNITERTPGGSSVNITLQWVAAEELQNFDRSESFVARFNGVTWQNGQPAPASGTNPFLQTRFGITNFSPFIVRNETLARPSTGIFPNPTPGELNVVLESPQQTASVFSVFDATGRLVSETWVALNEGLSQTRLNLESLPPGTYVLRVSTPQNAELLVQKFIRQH